MHMHHDPKNVKKKQIDTLSSRVIKIFEQDLDTPQEEEKKRILSMIRKLSMKELEQLYVSLKTQKRLAYPLITRAYLNGSTYDKMRIGRRRDYIDTIQTLAGVAINALPVNAKFCDIGCGTALVTVAVLQGLLQRGGKIYGCDVVNYIDPSVTESITFEKKTG